MYNTHYPYSKFASIWLQLLSFSLLISPITSFIFDRYTKYQGFQPINNSILFISFLFLLILSAYQRVKFSELFWLLIIYYISSSIIDSINYNHPVFVSKDIIRHQPLATAFLILLLDNANINHRFYFNIIKALWVIFFASIIVILYQQLISREFLTSIKLAELNKYKFEGLDYSVQYRNRSFWGLIGFESNGFSFNAIYAYLLNYVLKNKKNILLIVLFSSGMLFCFLTKTRWILVFFLIVSTQIGVYYKIGRVKSWKKYFGLTASIIILAITLIILGVPVIDTIQNRYLDKDIGGLTEGSLKSRVHNYRVFKSYFEEGMLLGWAYSGIRAEYYKTLERSADFDIIGVIVPIVNYGLLGSIYLYLFYLIFLRQLYLYGKRSKNYSYFLMVLGLIVSASSMGNFSLIDMGFIIVLVLYNFERRMVIISEPNTNRSNLLKGKT